MLGSEKFQSEPQHETVKQDRGVPGSQPRNNLPIALLSVAVQPVVWFQNRNQIYRDVTFGLGCRLPSKQSRSHQRGSVVVKKRIKPRALNFRSVPVAAFPHVRGVQPGRRARSLSRCPARVFRPSAPRPPSSAWHSSCARDRGDEWVAVRSLDAGDPGRRLREAGGSLRASWLVLVLERLVKFVLGRIRD
jgi:hypothetical protein